MLNFFRKSKLGLALENQTLRKRNNTLEMKLEEAQAINGAQLQKFLGEKDARSTQLDYYTKLLVRRNNQIKKLNKEIKDLREELENGSRRIRTRTSKVRSK